MVKIGFETDAAVPRIFGFCGSTKQSLIKQEQSLIKRIKL